MLVIEQVKQKKSVNVVVLSKVLGGNHSYAVHNVDNDGNLNNGAFFFYLRDAQKEFGKRG